MSPRRRVLVVVLIVLAAGCRLDGTDPVVLGGAPDTSASAIAERRALSVDPGPPDGGNLVLGPDATDVPDTGRSPLPVPEGETVPVLLFRDDDPVWVHRAAPAGAPDAVHAAIGALTEPRSPAETDAGLTTAVDLGTTVAGWNRRDGWLELRVEGAAFNGATSAGLRRRALQLACTAAAAIDPAPAGVDFVLGAPLDGVDVDDCPGMGG